MSGAHDLARMVPGFEFLQGLMKNAGAAMPGVPGMSQWIAPTLDPAEIEKRIQELKTVQFWLEQNARLLATTIQALEVQRMTLSTLQTMNLPLGDLRNALKVERPPSPSPAPAPASARDFGSEARAAARAQEQQAAAESRADAAAAQARAERETDADHDAAGDTGEAAAAAPGSAGAGPIDPLQWWGALTQQFTEIAAKAVQDGAATAAAARGAVGAATSPESAAGAGAGDAPGAGPGGTPGAEGGGKPSAPRRPAARKRAG